MSEIKLSEGFDNSALRSIAIWEGAKHLLTCSWYHLHVGVASHVVIKQTRRYRLMSSTARIMVNNSNRNRDRYMRRRWQQQIDKTCEIKR